jgi:hypothetical protein
MIQGNRGLGMQRTESATRWTGREALAKARAPNAQASAITVRRTDGADGAVTDAMAYSPPYA